MDITTDNDKKLVMFYPEGILDISASVLLEKALNAEFQRCEGFNFIINMKRVDSVCSSCIRVFVSFNQKLKESGSEVCITNLNLIVQELFNVASLDRMLRVVNLEREAVLALT